MIELMTKTFKLDRGRFLSKLICKYIGKAIYLDNYVILDIGLIAVYKKTWYLLFFFCFNFRWISKYIFTKLVDNIFLSIDNRKMNSVWRRIFRTWFLQLDNKRRYGNLRIHGIVNEFDSIIYSHPSFIS